METSRLLLQQEHDRLFGAPSRMDNLPRRMKDNRNEDEEVQDPVDVPQGNDTEEDNPEEQAPVEETNDSDDGSLGGETRIDLVKLVPFDVKLTLVSEADRMNTFALLDVVTEWMDESIAAQVKRMELGLTHSAFDSVILEERGLTQHTPSTTTTTSALLDHSNRNRRKLNLKASNTIASYEGVTLWKHTTDTNLQIMTPALLEDIERQALLQDDRLLELLQASPADGLGEQVQEVRAYINPNPTNYVPIQTTHNDNTSNATANANLELIIVVAIVVACMAFAFLVFSLFWAWRFDQQKRDSAYRVDPKTSAANNNKRNTDGAGGTDDSEAESPSNMNVVVSNSQDDDTALAYPTSETNPTTGVYPESVISEDISTSLSAYYRSGMGSRPLYSSSRALGTNDFNDQASFSSMESYGYSLDGYAPSLGGNNTRPQSDAGAEENNNDRHN